MALARLNLAPGGAQAHRHEFAYPPMLEPSMSQTPIRSESEAQYLRDLLDPRPYGVKPLTSYTTLLILQAHSCGWTNHGALTNAGKRALWDWNELQDHPQGSDWADPTIDARWPPTEAKPVDSADPSAKTVSQAMDLLGAPMVGRAPKGVA